MDEGILLLVKSSTKSTTFCVCAFISTTSCCMKGAKAPSSSLAMAVPSHESIRHSQPTCTCSMNTMPHRDTVAGDATARSSTSNILHHTRHGHGHGHGHGGAHGSCHVMVLVAS